MVGPRVLLWVAVTVAPSVDEMADTMDSQSVVSMAALKARSKVVSTVA